MTAKMRTTDAASTRDRIRRIASCPGGGPRDVATLTDLLKEAEEHHGHGSYEATAPKHHWSGFYAAYIVARRDGRTPEEAADDATRYMDGQLADQGTSS